MDWRRVGEAGIGFFRRQRRKREGILLKRVNEGSVKF